MKPYAFYPGARTRFQPMHANFSVPYSCATGYVPAKDNSPAANIVRKEGAYEIHLAVPGFSKDQIRLEVIDGQLIVTATNPNQEAQTAKFLRKEFETASFRRTFKLHKNANADALKASFDNGILTIVVPDREQETIKIDIH